MSNSADNAPAQTKKATMVYYAARPGSKDKKYDSPTPSFNRDNTSTNNQTLPETNDSEAGLVSSSTPSTSVDVLKIATTTSVTKVTENNSEGGSKEEGSSSTILETETTTSSLVTGQCSSAASTTETKAVTATQNHNPSSSIATTGTADHDVKNNDTTPATTSAATQTTVKPIDKNPALEKAVSDDSRINQAQLPTADDDGNPTESRVSHESNSEQKISRSSETHTESQSPNLQSPNHQKMSPNSRPEGEANTSREGEKLNTCCCCIHW